MRKIIFALLLTFLLPIAAIAEDNPLPRYEKQAQAIMEESFEKSLNLSTADAVEVINDAFKKVDKLLNLAYTETMKNLKAVDTELADLLLADQRAWLKFTEKFCYKAADGFGDGGTLYYILAAKANVHLWVERISFLRIINRNVVSEDVD